MRYCLGKVLATIFIFLISCSLLFAEDFLQVPLAIHVSSTVSDGALSASEIAKIAKDSKIKVVIYNEKDLQRWEYGAWPLRNLIKKRIETTSIFTYGIQRYLLQIQQLNAQFPGMVFIPGTESAPFYYWEGSPWRGDLSMHNCHKHILTVGLIHASDYTHLPVIDSPGGLYSGFQAYKLWPLVLLLLGWRCMNRGSRPPHSKSRSTAWRIISVAVIVIGGLFFVNNWPFYAVTFDQYHGDKGVMPYQNFIDYIRQHGGLTFWAHPEAAQRERLGCVELKTEKYTSDLAQTQNYTGFAIFPEGYKELGFPGGLWDEILNEYCRGVREKPAWAIGELDIGYRRNLGARMKNLRNILLVKAVNYSEIMQALREGRLYISQGKCSSEFVLDTFAARDSVTATEKTMGQELFLTGMPLLRIRGHFLNNQTQNVQIRPTK